MRAVTNFWAYLFTSTMQHFTLDFLISILGLLDQFSNGRLIVHPTNGYGRKLTAKVYDELPTFLHLFLGRPLALG